MFLGNNGTSESMKQKTIADKVLKYNHKIHNDLTYMIS